MAQLSPLADEVHVTDHKFFRAYPHELFKRMRREDPVFWSEVDQQWVLTKYEDIRFVSKNPEMFSNRYETLCTGSLIPDDHAPNDGCPVPRRAEVRRLRAINGWGMEMMLGSDGERHRFLRNSARSPFLPKAVTRLEERTEYLTAQLLEAIEPDTVVELVDAFAGRLPVLVIAELLGVETDDIPRFQRWAEAFHDVGTAKLGTDPLVIAEKLALVAEFKEYIAEQLASRLQHPREDLLNSLARTKDESGMAMALEDQVVTAQLLLLAGNETTRGLITAAVQLMCDLPDQRQILADNPALIPNAVEEFLRFTTPVTHMCRTALDDVELRGKMIRTGDYLCLVYPSANRDEDIWEDGDRLDVTRQPTPGHLAFGFAEHFCLGASLARLETRIALKGLLERFPSFESAGDVSRSPTHMTPGIIEMPIRLHHATAGVQ